MQKCGLTLNKSCESGKLSVRYVGHDTDESGVRADPDEVKATVITPPPKMSNQLGNFSRQLANQATPLRELLRIDSMLVWGHPQMKIFTT